MRNEAEGHNQKEGRDQITTRTVTDRLILKDEKTREKVATDN